MAKRFVGIVVRGRRHRLFSEDIDMVHKRLIRKLPGIPPYQRESVLHGA